MDVRFINPVLETLMNVLGTMANMEPRVGKPVLKQNQQALGEVSGFMRMESPQTRGSMAITFTRPVIFDIARRMLGAELTEIDDMARDLTGEMANMVVGGAKNLLVDKGFDFEMSLPEVLSGQAHEIKHNCDAQAIILPFKADSGDFYIEICFEDVA
ncbi:MAG: chemotaxis protein CheX [Gammaproteobacteria bacterium]